jgi:hypothetical protein
LDELACGIDGGKGPGREGCTGGLGELRQLEAPHLTEIERLGDGERPVPKLQLGRQHLDADVTFPQLTQSQGGLESRDAPAGDQYASRHLNRLLRA